MNVDQVEGNWRVLKGKIRELWGRVTDDHLKLINRREEMLAGGIQQTYGISMEKAERPVYEWQRSLEATDPYASVDADFDVVVEDRKPRKGS
ncbi:MAG TPA: hypothetical protein VKC11_06105 [Steroidobacteraceae bacterium]|nr:hypothetical protein [Steroidobacteraceae bacterium]